VFVCVTTYDFHVNPEINRILIKDTTDNLCEQMGMD
jgi:hypothetical protein